MIANIFQPLIDFFEQILLWFHDVGLSWGMSIIAMTVVVRAALLPLTFKQFKSMQALASHAPEMKRLQEKYKHDKERLNQEMMKFYRENKINPFASCLPLLAQLPVFLALFYMLQNDLRYDICPEKQPAPPASAVPCGAGGDASFLFIPDLTNKATGWVLAVLIVLYVSSQLFSTLLMSTTTDRTQRMIFLALPFVFVIFIINFPAGLLVYWITTNVWTIVQQTIIRRRLGPLRPATPEGESPPSLFGSLRDLSGGGSSTRDDGKAKAPAKERATARTGGGEPKARPAGPPPSPPRRKKKRSGRRR